jgi:hypothetical protein
LYEFQVFILKFILMPTVLRIDGYRFFFYSNENNEPAHIHVEKGNAEGKVWLEPSISVAYFKGFSSREQNEIINISRKNLLVFVQNWYGYFGK